MAAIWKDYYMTLDNMTEADFRICTGGYTGDVVYAGRAVAKPGATSLAIRINDICADFLSASVPDFGLSFSAGLLSYTFYLRYKAPSAVNWSNYATVTFTNEWSYDYHYDASRDGYSFPIRDVVDPRQIIMLTVPSGTVSVDATIVTEDGSSYQVVVPVQTTADFNNDFNNDYSIENEAASAGVVMLDLADYPEAVQVTMEGKTWTVDRQNCRDYAIYYVNAYGGWDGLAVYGSQTDAYTRHEYAMDYDNRKETAGGRVDYLNEIDMRFAVKTGLLTELGASRMHNLVGTTVAAIHELATGRILPVTVVTDSVKYKTYKSEGRTPISYELEVAVEQDRKRR